MGIDDYYTNLKIVWDEILMVRPRPVCICSPQLACICEVFKKVRENVNANFVMKFVKRINDSFESVRSRVLTAFPLADVI